MIDPVIRDLDSHLKRLDHDDAVSEYAEEHNLSFEDAEEELEQKIADDRAEALCDAREYEEYPYDD